MNSTKIKDTKNKYKIIGNCESLDHAIDVAIQVAQTDLSVLIIGESGVGKEVFPRIIHDNSQRKHNKYFAINCGSIPEGTIDSELFGHAKGSFTGAIGEREGYFSVANEGTLFLDEVGELPLATQARLLRVLENGEYIRVGESNVRKTNVRIVAATNVNLQKAIKEGRFREDLYYRLNTIPISLPPLRERGKDIELLFRKFAYDMAEKYRIDSVRLTEDAKELILKYKWPGNIRQLRNLTEQLSIISPEREITADILMQYGVTDDTAGRAGLVLTGSMRNSTNGESTHNYENERELLFHLMTKINDEVTELKHFVNKLKTDFTQGGINHTHQNKISQQNVHQGIEAQISPENVHIIGNIRDDGYEEVTAESYVEPTPLSNKELVKDNIVKALSRNRGNRKKTAAELGISERTLYRKIKELQLDF